MDKIVSPIDRKKIKNLKETCNKALLAEKDVVYVPKGISPQLVLDLLLTIEILIQQNESLDAMIGKGWADAQGGSDLNV